MPTSIQSTVRSYEPSVVGGGEIKATDTLTTTRGFANLADNLNTLFAKNATPCVNDIFPDSLRAFSSADTSIHRYRFRNPFMVFNSSVEKVEIQVFAQIETADIGEEWSFEIELNGDVSTVTLDNAVDTYVDGSYTRGVWSLGTYALSAQIVQELNITMDSYSVNLDNENSYVNAMCVVPIRTSTSLPDITAPFRGSVYPLPISQLIAGAAGSTYHLHIARLMVQAMYRERVCNLYTSSLLFSEDTTAFGSRVVDGIDTTAAFTTQIITALRPKISRGVSSITFQIYSTDAGGTLQVVTDAANVTTTSVVGWNTMTVSVADLTDPVIYFGLLNTSISSLCVYESTASLYSA